MTNKSVEITITTDWTCPENDHSRYAELRVEKSSFYASAIFELIERSCEGYINLSRDEVDANNAHAHLLAIREVAELGKHLAYQI